MEFSNTLEVFHHLSDENRPRLGKLLKILPKQLHLKNLVSPSAISKDLPRQILPVQFSSFHFIQKVKNVLFSYPRHENFWFSTVWWSKR